MNELEQVLFEILRSIDYWSHNKHLGIHTHCPTNMFSQILAILSILGYEVTTTYVYEESTSFMIKQEDKND